MDFDKSDISITIEEMASSPKRRKPPPKCTDLPQTRFDQRAKSLDENALRHRDNAGSPSGRSKKFRVRLGSKTSQFIRNIKPENFRRPSSYPNSERVVLLCYRKIEGNARVPSQDSLMEIGQLSSVRTRADSSLKHSLSTLSMPSLFVGDLSQSTSSGSLPDLLDRSKDCEVDFHSKKPKSHADLPKRPSSEMLVRKNLEARQSWENSSTKSTELRKVHRSEAQRVVAPNEFLKEAAWKTPSLEQIAGSIQDRARPIPPVRRRKKKAPGRPRLAFVENQTSDTTSGEISCSDGLSNFDGSDTGLNEQFRVSIQISDNPVKSSSIVTRRISDNSEQQHDLMASTTSTCTWVNDSVVTSENAYSHVTIENGRTIISIGDDDGFCDNEDLPVSECKRTESGVLPTDNLNNVCLGGRKGAADSTENENNYFSLSNKRNSFPEIENVGGDVPSNGTEKLGADESVSPEIERTGSDSGVASSETINNTSPGDGVRRLTRRGSYKAGLENSIPMDIPTAMPQEDTDTEVAKSLTNVASSPVKKMSQSLSESQPVVNSRSRSKERRRIGPKRETWIDTPDHLVERLCCSCESQMLISLFY